MILWNPATMGVSLQYSACYYISIVGIIIVLGRKNWEMQQIMSLSFMLGIAVAYFDFLTYPVATLGMPLITLCIVENKLKTKMICGSSFNWGVGYVAFWGLKWIIGTLLMGDNILADAFEQIVNRSSSQVDGEAITRLGALYRIINVAFVKWPYVIMIACVMIAVVVMGRKLNWKGFPMAFAMLIIAVIPFAWIILTANHSYVHPRLVYRTMGVTLYAVLAAWVSVFTKEKYR